MEESYSSNFADPQMPVEEENEESYEKVSEQEMPPSGKVATSQDQSSDSPSSTHQTDCSEEDQAKMDLLDLLNHKEIEHFLTGVLHSEEGDIVEGNSVASIQHLIYFLLKSSADFMFIVQNGDKRIKLYDKMKENLSKFSPEDPFMHVKTSRSKSMPNCQNYNPEVESNKMGTERKSSLKNHVTSSQISWSSLLNFAKDIESLFKDKVSLEKVEQLKEIEKQLRYLIYTHNLKNQETSFTRSLMAQLDKAAMLVDYFISYYAANNSLSAQSEELLESMFQGQRPGEDEVFATEDVESSSPMERMELAEEEEKKEETIFVEMDKDRDDLSTEESIEEFVMIESDEGTKEDNPKQENGESGKEVVPEVNQLADRLVNQWLGEIFEKGIRNSYQKEEEEEKAMSCLTEIQRPTAKSQQEQENLEAELWEKNNASSMVDLYQNNHQINEARPTKPLINFFKNTFDDNETAADYTENYKEEESRAENIKEDDAASPIEIFNFIPEEERPSAAVPPLATSVIGDYAFHEDDDDDEEGSLKNETYVSHPLLLDTTQPLDDDVINPRVPEMDAGMFTSALNTFQPTVDDVRVPDTHLAESDKFTNEDMITSNVEIDRPSTDDAIVPDSPTSLQPEFGEIKSSTENLETSQALVDDVIIPHTPEGFTEPDQLIETNQTDDGEESFIIPDTHHIPDTTQALAADGSRQEDEQKEYGDVARDTSRIDDDDEFYEYSPPSPNNKLVYEEPNGCIIEIYEDVEVEDDVSSQGTSPRSEDDFDQVELDDDDDDDHSSARIETNDLDYGGSTSVVDYQKLDRDEMTRDLQMPDYMEDSWIDDDIEEVDRYRDVNLLDQEKEVTNNKGLTYKNLSRHLEDAAEKDETASIKPEDDQEGDFPIQLQPVALQEQHLRDESDEMPVDLDHPDMYLEVNEDDRAPQQQQQQLQRKRQGCLRRFINRVASFFNCV